jgi:L-lactate dehydrogenase complex protein LldE
VRVALFITCVNDTLFPETGRATVALLERLGHEVAFPLEQTCCGQMHANSGYGAEALPLVDRFARVFGDPSYDAIVTPSGSCAAMVREQYAPLVREAGDLRLLAELEQLAPRVFELTQFVADELGVDDVGATFAGRVAYHPACHSLRALGIGDAPLRLLRNVRGLELVDLPDAQSCCGFGGTFAVKNADTSIAMLADKLGAVESTGADVVCAADNSCLLHIGGGLSRKRSGVRTMHVAEILAATA